MLRTPFTSRSRLANTSAFERMSAGAVDLGKLSAAAGPRSGLRYQYGDGPRPAIGLAVREHDPCSADHRRIARERSRALPIHAFSVDAAQFPESVGLPVGGEVPDLGGTARKIRRSRRQGLGSGPFFRPEPAVPARFRHLAHAGPDHLSQQPPGKFPRTTSPKPWKCMNFGLHLR